MTEDDVDDVYQACPQDDLERGDQYTFLSMERNTKLIINCMVAKRTTDNCHVFIQDLKGRIEGRFQLSTDGFAGYTGYLHGRISQAVG